MLIAFVQLGSFGDNINSTLMLKPIKDAYPGCQIEIHTCTFYESAFDNNPYMDNLVTYHTTSKEGCFDLYNSVPAMVKQQKYDLVFVPAPILHPNARNSRKHPEFGDNLICTFMRVLEDAGIQYEWPVKTILRLRDREIKRVDDWLASRKVAIDGYRNILMEVHGESGQTFWNRHWTMAVGRHLSKANTNLFISARDKTQDILHLERESRGRVRWCGDLTIRECAELYNRCGIFFSISSGLSNACNTDHCLTDKTWIETVHNSTVTSAPVRSTDKTFWYENDIGKFIGMLADRGI